MMVIYLLQGLVVAMALLLFVPVMFFSLQCWLGLSGQRKKPVDENADKTGQSADIVVLIPAHNEMKVIGNTLNLIVPQLAATDRVLVVADNCDDETASVVQSMQQPVVTRHNDHEKGKGYALAFGVEAIRDSPPAILVILDADCQILPNFIESLREQVMQTGLPAQADNSMYAPDNASVSVKISAFAVLVKNRIRMKGMDKLAGHVPMLGTGMAFPWETIQSMPLANTEIAEDIHLGLQLVLKDQGATYASSARITSALPADAEGQKGQRERWEQGHIDLIKRMLPMLLKQAFQKRSWSILASAIDLSIPPLSLLILLNVTLWLTASLLWWQTGIGLAFMLTSLNLIMIMVTVLACWWLLGRSVLRFQDLLKVPAYIWQKMSIYRNYLVAKQTKWVKTKR